MFTGLVADVGTVRRLQPGDHATTITLGTRLASERVQVGDSLAVDGACLTVVSRGAGEVAVTAVEETLARTTLGRLRSGQRVNLELPLCLGERLDGHLVLGHVDGVGQILGRQRVGDSWRFAVEAPAELAPFLVPKGSIAIDGISLTIASVADRGFEVSVIPHTLEVTTLGAREKGERVNLEVDIIGKYVAKMLGAYRGGSEGVTLQKLTDWGYL
jgi:riboflavin synthase